MALRYEQLIKQRFHVVSQHGEEFLCKCPYHEDTGRPNLYVNGAKGLFLCHACGAKGKIDGDIPADWMGLLERMRTAIDPPEPDFYDNAWLKQFQTFPTDYWTERGLSESVIRRFELGYDMLRDQGIIPVRDEHSRLVGAIRRNLHPQPGEPRYLYPKGFPLSKTLYGSWMLGAKHTKVALVEGSIDALSCWSARVPALALLGARLSVTQHRLLHRLDVKHIVIFTDNDTAGQDGADEIQESVDGLLVSRVQYRPYWTATDPGGLRPEQIRKAFHSAKRLNMRVD